jgi:hypothetical protein
VHHGYHHPPTGFHHPLHLCKQQIQIGDVIEHQGTHNQIESPRSEGETRSQIVLSKTDIRRACLRPRPIQHPLRKINRRDLRPRLLQLDTVPPRSTPDIKDRQAIHGADQWRHEPRFQHHQRIILLIVDRRPPVVAILRGQMNLIFNCFVCHQSPKIHARPNARNPCLIHRSSAADGTPLQFFEEFGTESANW